MKSAVKKVRPIKPGDLQSPPKIRKKVRPIKPGDLQSPTKNKILGAKYLEKEALRLKNTHLLAKKAKYYERMTRF
ncbi:hypothetical protein F7D95_11025 [Prevotella copri]|uniref:Uncharacterized protein n=1 Tax=Segatella copri TaxID=165179 RepID=A0AA90UHP9_9BACT|nr:hypothetical protein [Segatella copri]MQN13326.1 hypothetical protein [Segatella copri]